jgi:NAD(P)-dependent dehydrogenase (short-subunit alcohol dehydrogenase family)
MSGRTIVITGASDGIGAVAARHLAAAGERVVVVGRSPEKTRAVAAEIEAPAYVTDFADLGQVSALAADLRAACPRIDVLVNNAGAVLGDFTRTVDGFEKTLQVNHLAPFLLTHLLLDVLIDSRATVINTASVAARKFGNIDLEDLQNERAYHPLKAYGDAKLHNILFTRELHRRYAGRGLSAAAFHPGNVATNFASDTTANWRYIYTTPLRHLMLISPERGARTLLWLLAGRAGAEWQSGAYYVKTTVGSTNLQAEDTELARAAWDRSARLLGLPAAATAA